MKVQIRSTSDAWNYGEKVCVGDDEERIVEVPDDTRAFLAMMAPHGRFDVELSRDIPRVVFYLDYD